METWSFCEGRWQAGDCAGATLRWYDIQGAPDELEGLARQLDLHPLAVEDAVSESLHAAKVDEFGSYVFVVLIGLRAGDDGPQPEELDAFLGADFLVTYQDRPLTAVAETRAALARGLTVRPGIDGLFHDIADRLVDDLLPRLDVLSEELDRLQEAAVENPGAGALHQAILEVRARAGRLRRLMGTQLAVMQRFGRGEFPQIAEANRIYFRDIYDHLVRTDFILEAIREDAEVALGTYLSAINNRLSEVMKVLSVVGALALPASVIAGIFGTNFDNVPGLHSNWGFAAMIGGMTGLAGGMAIYFRRRGWF